MPLSQVYYYDHENAIIMLLYSFFKNVSNFMIYSLLLLYDLLVALIMESCQALVSDPILGAVGIDIFASK